MFTNKKSIVFIQPTKLKAQKITTGKIPKIVFSMETGINPASIPPTLKLLKKKLGHRIRLLLSEEFVYIVTLSIPTNQSLNHEVIRQKAQELIPDDLSKTRWTFKEIISPHIVAHPEQKTIQIIAIVRSTFESHLSPFIKSTITIECIEPMSYALARLVKKEKDPALVLYFGDRILLVCVLQGSVLATEFLNEVTQEKIDEFSSFIAGKFKVDIKKIIVSGNSQNFNAQSLTLKPDQTIELVALDPSIGLAIKPEIKKDDEEPELDLNLSPVSESIAPPPMDSEPQTQSPSSLKNILIVFFCVLLIAGAGLYLYLTTHEKKETTPLPTPTPVVSSKPKPTPTSVETKSASDSAQLDLTKHSISVLNGSGREGEAAKLKNVLEKKGFIVSHISNAPTIETTEVSYNSSVKDDYKLVLDKYLKTLYSNITTQELSESGDADVIITIGQN